MKKFLFALLLAVVQFCFAQTNTFNLDFETLVNGTPAYWEAPEIAGYTTGIDTTVAHSGKTSVFVAQTSSTTQPFAGLAFKLPKNYAGKKITLKGYIKTENVQEGSAMLWMRIDPQVAYTDSEDDQVAGTTDWAPYEITLPLNPDKTKAIIIGAILSGKGKVWFDDFTILIDGKDIRKAEPWVPKLTKGEMDTEFNEGSKIANIPTDKASVQKLEKLGRIWGFLKYYHPAVATGNYNWDYELFRVLPKVLAAKNNADFNTLMVSWIDTLGAFKQGKPYKLTKDEIVLTPDLKWIDDFDFSAELTQRLKAVENAKRPNKNYYIGLYPGVHNPEFKHEKEYENMKYPDAGFRLLTLYRYWNMIYYFYPNRHLVTNDWNTILPQYIPQLIQTQNEMEYVLTVCKLIGCISDTHANVWGESSKIKEYKGANYAAVKVTFIADKAVVERYYDNENAKDSGLLPGDVITHINNKAIADIIVERLPYYPASNYPTQLRDIAKSLLRSNEKEINVTYKRNGNSYTTTVKTYLPTEIDFYGKLDENAFRLITNDIAYINNGLLKKKDIPELWEKIKDTKGLIIDDRNYPSDFPMYNLSEYLMPKREEFVIFTSGNVQYPGLFTYDVSEYIGKKNKNYYKGKVIILVNEQTQSAAEYHAMAYRTHPNAIVMGSTTAGADGNMSFFYLPGGIRTAISGIGVLTPDRETTQRVGIIPDIEVHPTIDDIKKGEDTVLNKAIEVIEAN